MKRKALIVTIITFSTILLGIALFAWMTKAQASDVIMIPDSETFRILPDPQPDRYWVVDRGSGLILLEEDQPGFWSYQKFPIGSVMDATGPDPLGRFYCSFTDWESSMGVYVFDCTSESVIDTISLDYIPWGLTLSPDGTFLYVLAWVWPEPGEPFDSTLAEEHRDSGIILEINLTNYVIERTTATAALSTIIHYAEGVRDDWLVISSGESTGIYSEYGEVMGILSNVDIIDVSTFTRLEPRIELPYPWGFHYCDILRWPFDGDYVAVCIPQPQVIPDRPEFEDAIWIIDPESNSVVDTLHIMDSSGTTVGIGHAILSNINEDEVYISLDFGDPDSEEWIFVIDVLTGVVIRSINTRSIGIVPHFMHEIPDGRLIVTGEGSGKIAIIDPSQ